MASLTDLAFRILMDEIGGIGYMVTEMISVEGITRKNRKTLEMLKSIDFKTPQFIQLFGSDPDGFVESVKFLQNETPYNGIDINMGCPVKKITSRGAGAALLRDPVLAAKIVHVVRQHCSLPLTVKIRLCQEEEKTIGLIRALEVEGVDAITVHFRQVSERYSRPAVWDLASKIRGMMTATFIGNGDIRTVAEAIEKLKQVDGIMIGREALRKPRLFSDIASKTGPESDGVLSNAEFRVVIGRLLELIEELYPPELRLNRIKSYTRFMVAGRQEARNLRREVYASQNYNQARSCLARFFMVK